MSVVERFANRLGFSSRAQVESLISDELATAKQQLARSFEAAKISRLNSTWTTTPKTADYDIKAGLRQLVARSRDLVQNDDYIRAFVRLLKNNVVGSEGIKLQGRITDLDGTADTLANRAIEESWEHWCRKGIPDVTGIHSFDSLLRTVIATIAQDGEVIIRVTRGGHNAYNIALQLIDAQRLDVDHNIELANGHVIKMGVELNPWGKPVAYWLLDQQPIDNGHYSSKQYTRVPADDIIHLFLPESVAQTRGIPWTCAGMLRLKMLGGYAEAELVAARVASAKMGFFSRAADGKGYEGEDLDEDSDGQDGVLSMDAEPGVIDQLPDGVTFSEWNPTHPTTAFKDFVKANLNAIASGLGITYHALTGDLEAVNYSSGRLGRAEDQELYKSLQRLLIEGVCFPVFTEWLPLAFASGQVVIAGRPVSASLAKLDKFSRVTWQGRRWSSLDPIKEASANEKRLAARTTSISKIIREQGDDPDEVFNEIAEERTKLAALGITLDTPANAGVFDSETDENAGNNQDQNQ